MTDFSYFDFLFIHSVMDSPRSLFPDVGTGSWYGGICIWSYVSLQEHQSTEEAMLACYWMLHSGLKELLKWGWTALVDFALFVRVSWQCHLSNAWFIEKIKECSVTVCHYWWAKDPMYLHIAETFLEWWIKHQGLSPIPQDCKVVWVHHWITRKRKAINYSKRLVWDQLHRIHGDTLVLSKYWAFSSLIKWITLQSWSRQK